MVPICKQVQSGDVGVSLSDFDLKRMVYLFVLYMMIFLISYYNIHNIDLIDLYPRHLSFIDDIDNFRAIHGVLTCLGELGACKKKLIAIRISVAKDGGNEKQVDIYTRVCYNPSLLYPWAYPYV